MNLLLLGAAIAFITYSIAVMWRRPGFFAAVSLLTYGLSDIFGSVGPIAGALSIAAALAATSANEQDHVILIPEYFLFVWIGGQFLSLLTSPQFEVSIVYVASVVLLAGGSYLYARAFASRPHFFEDLLLGGAIVTCICTAHLLATARSTDVIGDSQGLSHVGLAVMPELCLTGVLTYLLFHRGHKLSTTIAIVVFTIAVLGPLILGLGTRSVMLSVGIGLVVMMGYRIWQGRAGRLLIGCVLVAAILAGLIALFWPYVADTVLGRIIMFGGARLFSGAVSGDVQGDPSSLIRLQLYKEAWDLFSRAPLFGSGAGSFGYLADNALGSYPHNMFLELLVQSGLVGTLAFLAFALPLAGVGFREMLKRPASWVIAFALMMLISAFVRHQVSMSITQGKLFFFALGCFAACRISESTRPLYFPNRSNAYLPGNEDRATNET